MKLTIGLALLPLTAYCIPLEHQRFNHTLSKRADPMFRAFPDGDHHKDIIMDAFEDTYELASYAQNLYSTHHDIMEKYFPQQDHPNILNVFKNIVPEPEDNTNVGNTILQFITFTASDTFKDHPNPERDLCKRGADGYTINSQTTSPPFQFFATTHICDTPFADPDDHTKNGVHRRIEDIGCEDFFEDGRYRVSNAMNFFGATILHEMVHFNMVGAAAFAGGPVLPDEYGSYIVDHAYDAVPVRKLRETNPGLCRANADSYAFAAMEIMWTSFCETELAGQNGRFADPTP